MFCYCPYAAVTGLTFDQIIATVVSGLDAATFFTHLEHCHAVNYLTLYQQVSKGWTVV